MSIELVSTELPLVDPAAISAWEIDVPAKSSIPKLPHNEQYSTCTRPIPRSPLISLHVNHKKTSASYQLDKSDDAWRIAPACCQFTLQLDEPTMND